MQVIAIWLTVKCGVDMSGLMLLGADGTREGPSFHVWRTGQSVAADVHGIDHCRVCVCSTSWYGYGVFIQTDCVSFLGYAAVQLCCHVPSVLLMPSLRAMESCWIQEGSRLLIRVAQCTGHVGLKKVI